MHFKIRQIFTIAITFKILFVLFLVGLFAIYPMNNELLGNKPNAILNAFYIQDGSNYQAICVDGYQKKYIKEDRESLKYMAFLPALPAVICAFEWFPGSIDMVWYGGLVSNMLLWILFVFALKYFLDGYYKDDNKKNYILVFFVIFPTSFYLHLNYTEVLFLPISFFIWRMIDQGKIKQSSILGFLLGFVRITAIPFGILMWIKYTINTYNESKSQLESDKINLTDIFVNKKYITNSLTFFLYGFGALLTFAFFKYEYGNFGLFFESQKVFYGRSTNIDTAIRSVLDVIGISQYHPNPFYRLSYWDTFDFSKEILNTGFNFYNKSFRQVNLYSLPFAFAFLSSVIMWKRKYRFELLYCWVLWLVPMFTDINSINRYIIQSFPFIIIAADASYDNKKLRYPILLVLLLLYLMYLSLHSLGFWIA